MLETKETDAKKGDNDGKNDGKSERATYLFDNDDDTGTTEDEQLFDINGSYVEQTVILPKWIIHPQAHKKLCWDISITILILYTCVEVPFTLGFDVDVQIGSFVSIFGFIIDLLLLCDIGVTFRTAIYNSDDPNSYLIVDPTEIATKYIKSWFVFDLITSIPFDFIFSGFAVIRIIRVFKLIKLFRIFRLFNTINNVAGSLISRAGVRLAKLIQILAIMATMSHYTACFWYFVGDQTGKLGNHNWIRLRDIEDAPLNRKYVASLYWSTTTLFTTGYGGMAL